MTMGKDKSDKTEAELQQDQIEAQHAAAAPAEESAQGDGGEQAEQEKELWDVRTHGPVPEGQEDQYEVVGDEPPVGEQVSGEDKQSTQQDG
jgi:hypothetical protein